MVEYIERQEALDVLDGMCADEEAIYRAEKQMKKISPADVERVRHAYWQSDDWLAPGKDKLIYCSRCLSGFERDKKYLLISFKYCPVCGAKIDGWR